MGAFYSPLLSLPFSPFFPALPFFTQIHLGGPKLCCNTFWCIPSS